MKNILSSIASITTMLMLSAYDTSAYAQTKTVSGTVFAEGKPVSGVVISQEGSNQTTISTNKGTYQIMVTGTNPVLIFRHPKYADYRLGTTGAEHNIQLQPKENTIDEVVINAGYYKVKDRERTGSIAKVNSKDIENQPVSNVLGAVQGRVAGVSITQNSGTAGSGFEVQIRGKNSLRYDGNFPLIIVDGIPLNTNSNSFSAISSGVLSKGEASPLNSINPNDIESFEILKDADATAIYGSRGANGVILITTKKGKNRKPVLQLLLSTSVSKVNKFLELANTEQYLQMRKDAFSNDGISTIPATAYDVNGAWDTNKYTDWYNFFIGKPFIGQQEQLTWAGGSDNSQFYMGISHQNQGSAFQNGLGYNRTGFLFNTQFSSPNKKFKIAPNFQYTIQNNNLVDSDLTRQIFLSPNAPEIYNSSSELNWENNTFDNPYSKLQNTYKTNLRTLSLTVNTEYEIYKKLSLRLNTGFTNTFQKEVRLNPSSAFNPNFGYTSSISSNYSGKIGRNNWIAEPQLSWDSSWRLHKVSALVGATWESKEDGLLRILASDFSSNAMIENTASAKVQKILEDVQLKYKYNAFFTRFNYSYNNRYIVNLTARRDGSSRFGPNNRYASFGAIGLAWLFSSEEIMKNVPWLTFGKLRVSVGTAGSDLIGDYQFLDTYTTGNQNYDGNIGMFPSRLYNPNFSWEKTSKLEAATELGFFKNKLNLNIAYYRNRSSNQLMGIALPATTGFLSVQSNFPAKVQNTGLEMELSGILLKNSSTNWSVFSNFTIPRSKLLQFDNIESSAYATTYEVGQSMNIKKVYELKGVNPTTGVYEFTDFNGDGKIDSNDRKKVVKFGTRFFGGLGSNFSYKNFKAGFLFQFVKQTQYSLDYNLPIMGIMKNVPAYMLDYWTPEHTQATYQRPTMGGNADAAKAYSQYLNSDAVIVNASYLRLNNLNFGYKINWQDSILNECFIQLQAQNIWTLTPYKGLDPEVQGLYVPSVKTYSLSVNLKF